MGSRQRHPGHPRVACASPLWTKLQQMAVGASAVFTDGSRASFRDVAGYYEGVESSKSSAGVALFRGEANCFVGIHIEGQPAMSNSYMTEMLALGLGVRLAQSDNLTVYSDCAAALGSLRLRQAKKVKSSPYWQLGMLLDLDSLVSAEKVRAHPERHVVQIKTLEDRGIFAADRFAGSPEGADLVLSAEEVLIELTRFSQISLVHLSDQSVAIGNLEDLRSQLDVKRYLARRDE